MERVWKDVLLFQLAVGRQGELCRRKWWNVDATDRLGGYSIVEQFFTGNTERQSIFARLCTGEALLFAAGFYERSLFLERSQKKNLFGLFTLPFGWQQKVEEVWKHFKTYPIETPAEILEILDPDLEGDGLLLKTKELIRGKILSFEKTPIGCRVEWDESDPLSSIRGMAGLTISHSEDSYPLVYFESARED